MRKLKTPLLILFTVMILVACASLPAIAASVQDSATVNYSGYSDMESLKLDFSGERGRMPLLGKLALIRDGNFYTVSPSATVIRQSEIEYVVQDGLALYYEAELIPYNWVNYEFSPVPYLVSSPLDVEDYAILWVVSIHWPESGDVLELYVDDDTGLILYLHFSGYSELETYTAWGYLDALSNAYFESTGISEIMADPETYGVKDMGYDDSGLRVNGDKYYVHSLLHPDYGTLNFEFHLYSYGFYVIIR